MSDETKINSGALFSAAQMKIIRQGPVNIQGHDEQLMIAQVTAKNHQKFYEVYQKVGAIFPNDDKHSENSPDMSGKITYGGMELRIAGWKKESERGIKFTSIGISIPEAAGPAPEEPADEPLPEDDPEDDIPF
jgi:uncharacterized protein (DUF736 family)